MNVDSDFNAALFLGKVKNRHLLERFKEKSFLSEIRE